MADIKTEQALRTQRIEIYCKELKTAHCSPGAIHQALGITGGSIPVPPEGIRGVNFRQFVEQNFVQETDIFAEAYLYSWRLSSVQGLPGPVRICAHSLRCGDDSAYIER